eukprot:2549365-Alexandrium_andersonii.AAC.1
MSASLVGSEMCIRDSGVPGRPRRFGGSGRRGRAGVHEAAGRRRRLSGGCLLYTSDAADDM